MIKIEIINKIAKQLKEDGVACLMIAPNQEMKYIIGSKPYLCERFQALFIKDDGDFFYFCNALTHDEATDFMEGHDVYSWHDSDGFEKLALEVFTKHDLLNKKIAVNGAVRAFNLIKLQNAIPFIAVNGKDYLELARIIKTPEELDNLRKAASIVDYAIENIKTFIKVGMSEKEIDDEMIRLCKEGGCDACDGGIVSISEHAAMPHYFGKSGIVKEHSIVLIDYGCTYKGMWSDITRCIFVGKASERERYIYNLVLQANLAGEKAAVDGAFIPDIDKAARKPIEEAGFGQYFNHRLGHGIGYAGHEAPYIHGDYPLYLKPGMAFSCEPGIYIKDEIGIRIEDIVIINEKGETEVLNKVTKELVEITGQ